MFGSVPNQADLEREKRGERKAAYTCGRTKYFEAVVVWPPLKCQDCKKGDLVTGHWCSQLDQKPAKI